MKPRERNESLERQQETQLKKCLNHYFTAEQWLMFGGVEGENKEPAMRLSPD